MKKLFTKSSAKLEKSQNEHWLNSILYLEPSVDYKTICKASTESCRASCLTNSGMMVMSTQTNARINRTKMYLFENELFMKNFYREIDNMVILAKKQGKRLALRLNGTSDLDWIDVYKKYPDIQFYEYTKRPDMVKKTANIENVHMTFSRTEKTKDTTVQKMLLKGVNVAVVFDDKREIPLKYYNVNVIDGDKHDRRFEDSQGSVVGLKLKGTNKTKALARATGFAV
jgi:hypothetical protein